MKSISEKAEEYAKMKHTDKSLIDIVSWDFEAGANYVLGEVEKIFSKANKYKDGSDRTILYLDIEFLVKQLKK